ncbi:MAG: hypothetical protein WDO18_11170 [Acidobacteriota bacterium]
MPPAPRTVAAPVATPPPPAPAPIASSGDFRARLHATLVDEKKVHLADAVENSDVTESAGEITFTSSKMYQMYLKDPALEAVVKRVAGRPVRIAIKVGEVSAAPRSAIETQSSTRRQRSNRTRAVASRSQTFSGTVPWPSPHRPQFEGE